MKGIVWNIWIIFADQQSYFMLTHALSILCTPLLPLMVSWLSGCRAVVSWFLGPAQFCESLCAHCLCWTERIVCFLERDFIAVTLWRTFPWSGNRLLQSSRCSRPLGSCAQMSIQVKAALDWKWCGWEQIGAGDRQQLHFVACLLLPCVFYRADDLLYFPDTLLYL